MKRVRSGVFLFLTHFIRDYHKKNDNKEKSVFVDKIIDIKTGEEVAKRIMITKGT